MFDFFFWKKAKKTEPKLISQELSSPATAPSPNPLFLYNTLSKAKEQFFPSDPTGLVTMYNCGPTVYGKPHVGNLRAYVFADTLKRVLIWNHFTVKQVINITDVGHLTQDTHDDGEDKMTVTAKKEQKTAQEIATFYTEYFFKELDALHIDRATIEFPRASAYIPQQIALIEALEKKGYTYRIKDGVYFDTSRFPAYGKLGAINLEGLLEGKRIGIQANRKNPSDFALWKFSLGGEQRQQEWPSPWGVGFPGWHIECSAMIMDILGNTIDIHTGGVDHIPVHHNNEIAQSESVTGTKFVRFWLHNGHLTVGGEKISKSLFNTYYLEDLYKKGFEATALRYFFLGASYRTTLNFTWEAIEAAQTSYDRLIIHFTEYANEYATGVETKSDTENTVEKTIATHYTKAFTDAINDDLNTPVALSVIWKMIDDASLDKKEKYITLLEFDKVLGLNLLIAQKAYQKHMRKPIGKKVQVLLEKRRKAREDREWENADALRDQIREYGYEVKDTAQGQILQHKRPHLLP